jgi:hypothetical protein
MRLRIVVRRTMNRPDPFFPLMCVKPGKSNVSDLPPLYVSASVRRICRTRSDAPCLDGVQAKQARCYIPEWLLAKWHIPTDADLTGAA